MLLRSGRKIKMTDAYQLTNEQSAETFPSPHNEFAVLENSDIENVSSAQDIICERNADVELHSNNCEMNLLVDNEIVGGIESEFKTEGPEVRTE